MSSNEVETRCNDEANERHQCWKVAFYDCSVMELGDDNSPKVGQQAEYFLHILGTLCILYPAICSGFLCRLGKESIEIYAFWDCTVTFLWGTHDMLET